jgi:hypothetical protein
MLKFWSLEFTHLRQAGLFFDICNLEFYFFYEAYFL